ncbi:MAG: hypothetical protein MJZ21_03635 [archaeon]|nr:hypothetical protein [archaeon]
MGLRKNLRRSGETEIVRMWVDSAPVVRFMKGYDGFIQEIGNGGDMPR